MDVVGLLRVRSLPQMCSQLAMEHSALESPPPPAAANTEDDDDTDEDDDISVGCPSPSAAQQQQQQQPSSFNRQQLSPASTTSSGASSCFSTRTTLHDASDEEDATPSVAVDDDYFKPLKRLKMMKINKGQPEKSRVRVASPVERHTNRAGSGVKSFFILDILNHRPERAVSEPTAASRIVRPWDLGTGAAAATPQLRPKSADFCYASETTCSSGRSSTAGSDCCTSPDIAVSVAPRHGARHLQRCAAKAAGPKGANTSPLDALFQMTSKTFEELNGEAVADGQANHLNLFNSRQQAKKKRKSRTAFTNHQIFELEKRFLYQKYLSPADRDEIAGQLGLSNAQVITWFQNRRAKLKRDMEELKKDVESTKLLSAHKSFLENVTDLGILKKKSPTSGGGAVVTDGGGGDK